MVQHILHHILRHLLRLQLAHRFRHAAILRRTALLLMHQTAAFMVHILSNVQNLRKNAHRRNQIFRLLIRQTWQQLGDNLAAVLRLRQNFQRIDHNFIGMIV